MHLQWFQPENKARKWPCVHHEGGWGWRRGQRQGPSWLILIEAPSFEGSYSLTFIPSKSQHFLKFLLLSCLLQSLPSLTLFPTVSAFFSEIWECWWLYFPNPSSKPVRQAAIYWWSRSWRITWIHQVQSILSRLNCLHSTQGLLDTIIHMLILYKICTNVCTCLICPLFPQSS